MAAWLLGIALVLGPPTSGPSRVELDVSGLEQHLPDTSLHRFHGELLLRLLEAGHGVGAEGDVILSLTSTGSSIEVECRFGDRRERIEVDDTEAAVLGLELVHHAIDLVGRCTIDSSGSADAIVVDSDDSIELAELVVSVADAPITLVIDERDATWRLCVREREAFVVALEHACDASSNQHEFVGTPTNSNQSPREAVERWRASLVRPVPEPEPEPEPEPRSDPPAEPRVDRRRVWGASVGAAAGVVLRLPGVAADVHVDLAAVHRSGVLVGAAGSLSPSRADQLAVIDGFALAVVGWRGQLGERVVLRPSLQLGLAIHGFAYAEEPRLQQVDLAIRVPLELQVLLGSQTYLTLAVVGTVTPHAIEHRYANEVLWSREVVQLDALIGVRFDWVAPR